MPRASRLPDHAAAQVASGELSPGVAFAAANAQTMTLQECRIARLFRTIKEAKTRGEVTTMVRLVDLEVLICAMALTDRDVRTGANIAFAGATGDE